MSAVARHRVVALLALAVAGCTGRVCDDLLCSDCTACALDAGAVEGSGAAGGGSASGEGSDESDRGACADAYAACAPDDQGSPCNELARCIDDCDANDDGALSPGTELDCVCANDGVDCTEQSLEGSCHDVHAKALALEAQLEDCLATVCKQACL